MISAWWAKRRRGGYYWKHDLRLQRTRRYTGRITVVRIMIEDMPNELSEKQERKLNAMRVAHV